MPINTLALWHELVRAKSPRGLDALLADEVVLHSPIVHTPQVGKPITLQYLTAAFRVFLGGNFRYIRELAGPHDAVLEFLVELDGITVNGIDMIRWNDTGLIVEFKVMIRPLQAIKLVHQKMAAAIAPVLEG